MAFNTLSTRILLVILIVYSGSFNHCFAQDTEACSTSVTGICGAPGSHVSETPQGVIDGRNSTFRIRLVPSNDSEITVFRNGLKLIRGVDYQVTGQLVTTSPTSTPAPGDVLRIVYSPNLGKRATAESAMQISTPGITTIRGASEFSKSAARAALMTEEAQVQSLGQAASRPISSRTYLGLTESERAPESLKMLSQQVRRELVTPSDKRRNKVNKNVNLQGPDGLGDFGTNLRIRNEGDSTTATRGGELAEPLSSDIASQRHDTAEQDLSGSSSAAIRLLKKRLDVQRGDADHQSIGSDISPNRSRRAKSEKYRMIDSEN